MNTEQHQYWLEMYQLKVHINFIELLLESDENVDRFIKIILAIASSASISIWAVWEQYPHIWATVIAASQVVNAILPYIPYKKRIKECSLLLPQLETLMIDCESKWNAVAKGELTAKQIHTFRFNIKKSKQQSINKYVKFVFPTDSKKQKKLKR